MPIGATNSRSATIWRKSLLTAGVWIGSVLVILATLSLLAGLAWKKFAEIQAAMNTPPPPEMPTLVGARPVGTIEWRNSMSSIGTILAPRSITVNNEMPGTVAELLFEPGQLVEENTKLLQLDDSVEKAQLKAAKAREDFALAMLKRNQQLSGGEAISESELEEHVSRWQQAQANVEELQAMIDRKAIIAPFRGRVGLSDVQKGQYLAGGTMITTLQSVENHVLVEFTLPQSVVNQIKLGDPLTVTTIGAEFSAKVSAIDAQADRLTRSVRVRARIDDAPKTLSPGDSVSVLVAYGPQMEFPAVPAESIRRSPQGTFIYMAEQDAAGEWRASARPVVLATSVDSTVGIARGVSKGESVIVEGSFKIQDGALIAVGDPSLPEKGK